MTAAKKTTGVADQFDAFSTMSPDSFKEGYEKISQGMTALADFQKSTFEAAVTSANIWFKGVEKVAAEGADFSKARFEEGVEAAKSAASSKTVQEAFDANNQFVRVAVEKNVEQFNKIANLWVEATKEAAEPMTARYNEFVELVQSYRP